MTDFTFPNSHRLHGESRFRDVFRYGKRRSVGPFTLHMYARETSTTPRLGLVVSRFQGNAVSRNAAKRVAREVFRHVKADLPFADYILRVHRRLDSLPRADWASALHRVFASARVRHAGASS